MLYHYKPPLPPAGRDPQIRIYIYIRAPTNRGQIVPETLPHPMFLLLPRLLLQLIRHQTTKQTGIHTDTQTHIQHHPSNLAREVGG